jgi:hypothetical protein
VLGFPPEEKTAGCEAIRAVCDGMLEQISHFEVKESLPTPRSGDLALTSTVPGEGTGGRVRATRRQADGNWLRVIDRPETPRSQNGTEG